MELDDQKPTPSTDGEMEFDELDQPTEEDSAELKERERKRKLHRECIDAFKASADFFSKQRELDTFWRKFYRAIEASDQWDQASIDARAAFEDGQAKHGERPTLTINEIKQPIQQGINEARQARLGLYVTAEGNASKQEAETRQGLLRGIQYHSNAAVARLWALESAFITGRGWYRVNKEYATDGDDSLDLRIGMILHQENVYPDPTCSQLDRSDATDDIIIDDLSHSEFRRRFPDAQEPTPDDTQLESFGQYKDEWVNNKTWRIGERYYVVQKIKAVYRNEETGQWLTVEQPTAEGEPQPMLFENAKEAAKHVPEGARWRAVPVRRWKWVLFSASDILEEGDWEGEYSPLIGTVGRVHVVEGKVYYKGLVCDGVNPQQLINFSISSLAEQVGSGTKAPWILDMRQIENYLEWWNHANTENFAYLPIDRMPDGQDLGEPRRNTAEPPIIATLQVLQQARDLLKAATGRFGASLGDISPDRSGKAINALKVQGELGSSDFLDNLANLAMVQESRCLNSMMFPVYGYEGRQAKLIGETPDEEQAILINKPFTVGEDGRPRPVDEPGVVAGVGQRLKQAFSGMMGRQSAPLSVTKPPTDAPPQVKEYRLTKQGTYAMRWVVGKAQVTEQQENVATLTGILESVGKVDPQLARETAIALLENLDGPAARKLVERLTPKGPNGEEIPPQLQQILEQLKAERDEAVAAAQEMQGQLKGKQMDLAMQRDLQMADQQFKYQLEAQRLNVELLKIETSAAGKLSEQELKIRLEELKGAQRKLELLLEQQHEKDMQLTEIAAEERQQDKQIDAQAEQQERGAVLGEAARQNQVRDSRVDAAVDASRQSSEAEKDRQAAERQAQQKAQQPKRAE